MKYIYDVLIVGGGPAGLSAALTLGRARRHCLIIDDESPRNHVTKQSHTYLTRDGVKTSDFRVLARRDLIPYSTISTLKDNVLNVTVTNDLFQTETAGGNQYHSRKILFSTGLKDVLPPITGLKEIYGKSAFLCPYCDGWEFRDHAIAVVGGQLADFHFIKALTGWSHDLALFTNGQSELSQKQFKELQERKIQVYHDAIKRYDHDHGRLKAVVLNNGQTVSRQVVFFNPPYIQSTNIPQRLGIPLNEKGLYETDNKGATRIHGFYLAGDNTNPLHQLVHAAADGAKAALHINMELIKADWKH